MKKSEFISKDLTAAQSKKAPKVGEILGVPLYSRLENVLLIRLEEFLQKTTPSRHKLTPELGQHVAGKFFITTPNPEQVYLASKDRVFKQALLASDVRLCDGTGLAIAMKYLSLKRVKIPYVASFVYLLQGIMLGFGQLMSKKVIKTEVPIIRGREFFLKLVRLASLNKWRIFLLGGNDETSVAVQRYLKKKYPKLKIESFDGPNLNNKSVPLTAKDKAKQEQAVQKINKQKPHILFVGFGSPKQEKWIYKHLEHLNVGGTMVVGGTFDYITGTRKKVPGIFTDLGLEWLWRLLTGSQQLGRVFNAVFRFPLLVYKTRLDMT